MSECQFFVHDMEQQGNGLRGVVYNALIDSKRLSGLKDLRCSSIFILQPSTTTSLRRTLKMLMKVPVVWSSNTRKRSKRREVCFSSPLTYQSSESSIIRVFPRSAEYNHPANARNDEWRHEYISLTVLTNNNQLSVYRQSDKVSSYPRTILNCEEYTIPISIICPQISLDISQTSNQSFSCIWIVN